MKTLSKHHIEAIEKAKANLGKVNAAAQHDCGFGAGCCYQAAKSEADEALLRQALECLERSETTVPYEGFGILHREAIRKHAEAVTALRERLGETK